MDILECGLYEPVQLFIPHFLESQQRHRHHLETNRCSDFVIKCTYRAILRPTARPDGPSGFQVSVDRQVLCASLSQQPCVRQFCSRLDCRPQGGAAADRQVECPIGAFTGVEHQGTRTPEMCQVPASLPPFLHTLFPGRPSTWESRRLSPSSVWIWAPEASCPCPSYWCMFPGSQL